MPRRPRIHLIACALFLLGAGCAELPTVKVGNALRAGDPAAALTALEDGKDGYGSKGRLLYLMDQAALQHYAGQLSASAQTVDDAAKLVDELYSTSVSEQALSFLSNDMATSYGGEHFEQVLLHVLGLLDYAALGQKDDALVEARRADEKLKSYAQAVGPDKVAYKDDALARYLSALLYESDGRQGMDDAYLDYKKADAAYDAYGALYGTPKPQRLKADLQRVARTLGESAELEQWRQRDGDLAPKSPPPGSAELVVLLYDGLVPVKVSQQISLPLALNDGTRQYFSLAIPHFVVAPRPLPQGRLMVPAQSAPLELFEDVNAIAVRDLKERMAMVMVKESARALVKFQAARLVQQKAREQGEGFGLLASLATNVYGLVSSQADIRSWRTLPGRIWIARLWVPAGPCHPRLYLEQDGNSQILELGALNLKPNERRFLVRTLF